MTITPDNNDILRDARGNTASIKYFGSREAAQEALDSLVDCDDCEDCSDCSRCSRCRNVHGRTEAESAESPPPVPVIPDIHARVYAAAPALLAALLDLADRADNFAHSHAAIANGESYIEGAELRYSVDRARTALALATEPSHVR